MVRRNDAVKRVCSYRGFMTYGRAGPRNKKKSKKPEQADCESKCSNSLKEDSAFTITLRDVEDFDARDLNVIPSSLENIECTPWTMIEDKIKDPKKLFGSLTRSSREDNDGFCPVCTAHLLGLKGSPEVNDVCTHSSVNSNDDELIVKAKNIIEQNVLTFLSSLANDKPSSLSSLGKKTPKRRNSATSDNTVVNVRTMIQKDMERSKIISTDESYALERKYTSKTKNPKINCYESHARYLDAKSANEKNEVEQYVPPRLHSSKRKKSGFPRAEREITCTMSKVSMQAYMSSSKSEVTAAIVSEAVQTQPMTTNRHRSSMYYDMEDLTSSKENRFSEYSNLRKLQNVCGKMLLEMCNVRDQELGYKLLQPQQVPSKSGNTAKSEFPFYHLNDPKKEFLVDSHLGVRRDLFVNRAEMPVLSDEFPIDWLQGLHWNKSLVNPMPYNRQPPSRTTTEKQNLRPLLCTKLSIPWLAENANHQTNSLENRQKLTSTVEIQTENTGIRRRSISRRINDSLKTEIEVEKKDVDKLSSVSDGKQDKDSQAKASTSKIPSDPSHSGDSAMKTMSKNVSIVLPDNKDMQISVEEPTMDKVEVVCAKCKSGRSLTPPKNRNITKARKLYKVRSKRGRIIRRRKLRSSSRHSRSRYRPKSVRRRESISQCDKMANLLIRSLFAGSSSEVKPKPMLQRSSRHRYMRSPRRTRERLASSRQRRLVRRTVKARRKRYAAQLQSILARQGRLRMEQSPGEQPPKLDDSAEVALINNQIKALAEKHRRREGASPYHGRPKKMPLPSIASYPPPRPGSRSLDHPRRRSVRRRGTPRRAARRSLERRKINNESLFSCWLPKVFKL